MAQNKREPMHRFVWHNGPASCSCGWSPPSVVTDAPRAKLRKRLREQPGLLTAAQFRSVSRALSVRTMRRDEAVMAWGVHVAGERTEGTERDMEHKGGTSKA
ncbi:protein of unknown function [Nitrospira japonica]|uniref:Uncharacterized protein n=1 Tax=Nitrospira japonica TaxID=1325564 RepID=A0A1W1I8I3_9BACT|nr:hypothetical protein [Nitrospira japonica]SLM49231.1 protein of unknown function [Nitrospira japonica]